MHSTLPRLLSARSVQAVCRERVELLIELSGGDREQTLPSLPLPLAHYFSTNYVAKNVEEAMKLHCKNKNVTLRLRDTEIN